MSSQEDAKKEEDKHLGKDYHFIPMASIKTGTGREERNDVYYYTNQIVNIVFIGEPGSKKWFLIDTGVPNSTSDIKKVVNERFNGQKPELILLTHGHFDHVGAVVDLVKEWNIPVYAHSLEMPYLTGEKAFPKPDTSVEGGGLLANLSFIYPTEPIQLGNSIHPLPPDHSIPGFPEWKWIHTPGHTPGHVCFFRERDRVLIAGDAFTATKQDSFFQVLFEKTEIHEPPPYLTLDWKAAGESIKKLNTLNPDVAITSHGEAITGPKLSRDLNKLAINFKKYIPAHGKFVET